MLSRVTLLFFLSVLMGFVFGCSGKSTGGGSTKNNKVESPGGLTADQKQLAILFYQSTHGQWTEGCQTTKKGSFEEFLKFDSETSGNQKIVTYSDQNCSGSIKDYSVRVFNYQITSMNRDQSQVAATYDATLQFEELEEGKESQISAVFKVEGSEITYLPKGSASALKLTPVETESL